MAILPCQMVFWLQNFSQEKGTILLPLNMRACPRANTHTHTRCQLSHKHTHTFIYREWIV